VNEPGARFRTIFFEVFGDLPRQGPGDLASAVRALELCRELPRAPAIVDLGCGAGGHTLQLAELLPDSTIVAIDLHAPSIERLRRAVVARGLERRIRGVVGDMANPGEPLGSFDLVWSEGALYCVGLPAALRVVHDLLRSGGYVAFTEAIWRQADPPPDVRALFDLDYPTMGWSADALAAIGDAGLELVGHFVLPDEAWWDEFYTPMEARIAALRAAYAGDDEALAILDQLAAEPETHRRHAAFYGYEFFVARRPVVARDWACGRAGEHGAGEPA
jgi:SAM-dependent methyltransferase